VLLAFWVDAEPVDRSGWLLWIEPGKQTEAENEQPPTGTYGERRFGEQARRLNTGVCSAAAGPARLTPHEKQSSCKDEQTQELQRENE
jgi:hypothetical protein